jgi:hypothetical protein
LFPSLSRGQAAILIRTVVRISFQGVKEVARYGVAAPYLVAVRRVI